MQTNAKPFDGLKRQVYVAELGHRSTEGGRTGLHLNLTHFPVSIRKHSRHTTKLPLTTREMLVVQQYHIVHAGPWEPPPAPPGREGPQPCLGAPPQLQYFYCFTFLILKIIIYISMIKCHGQLTGTGGGINSTILATLCCTKAFSNLQAWKRK